MALPDDVRSRIESLIAAEPVVVFMKGSREAPQCGFSATVCGLLDGMIPEYATVDVLADHGIREGIKEFSSWPTIPQLYVRGEFVGGCDIVKEMAATGELQKTLGLEMPEIDELVFEISAAAAEEIRNAQSRMSVPPGYALRVRIDAKGQSHLGFDREAPGDHKVESNGVSTLVDVTSAARVHRHSLDVTPGEHGPEFRLVPLAG